jgi:hypothetical protein
VLLEEPTHRIQACRPRCHPLRADPVERQQFLLADALYRHRSDLSAAHGFKQRLGIRPVRLVPADVGAHVLGRQPRHVMAVRPRDTSPVVRRAARLHHDVYRWVGRDEPFELRPSQPLASNQSPGRIGERELEHRLCQVHTIVVASMSASSLFH